MVGVMFALFLVVVLPVRYVWIAIRVWRDPTRAVDAASSFSVRGAPGWVLTRGVAVVATQFVFMGVFVATAPLAARVGRAQKHAEPWWAISLVAGAGVLLCWLLITLIGIFNRPRFLVVPYLRDRRRL